MQQLTIVFNVLSSSVLHLSCSLHLSPASRAQWDTQARPTEQQLIVFAGIGQLQRLDTLIDSILLSLVFGGLVGDANISPGVVVAAIYLFV